MILLEIRQPLGRILRKGRDDPHTVVEFRIIGRQFDCFGHSLSRFAQQPQAERQHTELIGKAGIVGLQISSVGQVSECPLIILAGLGDTGQIHKDRNRRTALRVSKFQCLTRALQLPFSFLRKPKYPQTVSRKRILFIGCDK